MGDFLQPLPGFRITEASQYIALASGWFVFDIATGNFVWTGGFMTISEARDRLLLAKGASP